jgi:hypothetical protein
MTFSSAGFELNVIVGCYLISTKGKFEDKPRQKCRWFTGGGASELAFQVRDLKGDFSVNQAIPFFNLDLQELGSLSDSKTLRNSL